MNYSSKRPAWQGTEALSPAATEGDLNLKMGAALLDPLIAAFERLRAGAACGQAAFRFQPKKNRETIDVLLSFFCLFVCLFFPKEEDIDGTQY